MNRIIFLIFIISSLTVGDDAIEPMPKEEFSNWTTYYYSNKLPEYFRRAIKTSHQMGILRDENSSIPMTAFFGHIIRQNPDSVSNWLSYIDKTFSFNEKEPYWRLFWYSQTDLALNELRLIAKRANGYDSDKINTILSRNFKSPLKYEVDDPSHLDELWGSFLVTGDIKYVNKITSVLDKEPDTKDMEKAVVLRSAIWSLRSNASMHLKVYDYLEDLLNKSSEPKKTLLKQILNGVLKPSDSDMVWLENKKIAKKQEFLDNKNGFGGQLLITDDFEFFQKWNTVTNTVKIRTMTTALRDRPFYVIMLFTDPGKDEKGIADITGNIKITDPEGNLYGETKDGIVWNKRTYPKGQIGLSLQNLGVKIEEQDPAGKYIVEAEMKDNIKDVTLNMKNSFYVE